MKIKNIVAVILATFIVEHGTLSAVVLEIHNDSDTAEKFQISLFDNDQPILTEQILPNQVRNFTFDQNISRIEPVSKPTLTYTPYSTKDHTIIYYNGKVLLPHDEYEYYKIQNPPT